ncbi:dynein regulatory complex protein 10-like [Astyanax mexicanus]|uniref:dynein regulatory complex protein 10-like n=2 Tax=Astyanax mexicanus TaxID=7994 RepID=UPI0020CB0E47|nr:dynein regulatory complex protein 10-like [Astyanax mexicanus]
MMKLSVVRDTKPLTRETPQFINLFSKKRMSPKIQRIVGVLDECIYSMELVALLPSEETRLQSLSQKLRPEMTSALAEDLRLGKEYETLSLDPEAEGQEAAAEAVQTSFLNVSRLLRSCPSSAEVVLKDSEPLKEDRKGVQEMLEWLKDYRSFLLQQLYMTPREERLHLQQMREAPLRYESNQEALAALEREMAATIEAMDKEISWLSKVIDWLKRSMDRIEKRAEDFVAQKKNNAERRNESLQKTSQLKQAQILEEISQLELQLESLIKRGLEDEREQRKRCTKLRGMVEDWIDVYDTEIEQKQTELEETTQLYEMEMAELSDLQKYHAVREVEYLQVVERRRIEKELREKEERERGLRIRAAAVILQSFWKGWRVRKAMKEKSKKSTEKKKGKGKGKKGKGKKGK